MFAKTDDEISYYPTDLFLSEQTHNSFKDLEEMDWEFKEEIRIFIEEKIKFQQRQIEKNKG